MAYSGPERRKFPRIEGRFIVSYRILEEPEKTDITQTKNLCLGGMLLTTNRRFEPGTRLGLEIRLPFEPHPITLIGRVIESQEVTKGLIFDTRLAIIEIDKRHREVINKTVAYYLKRSK